MKGDDDQTVGSRTLSDIPFVKKEDMFVCSNSKSKVAFISPTQKLMHTQLGAFFERKELGQVLRGEDGWRYDKAGVRFKEGS